MANLTDASSAIYAWDNYPQDLFPDLWGWLAKQVSDQKIQSIKLIMDEIKQKTPECYEWLQDKKIKIISLDNAITQAANIIKKDLEIIEDGYSSSGGVGENDIFLIATAVISKNGLMTNEAEQITIPKEGRKYKIPLVCKTRIPKITSYTFIKYIKEHWHPHQYDI